MSTVYHWTDGSGRLYLRLNQDDVNKGYHQGACDDDIEYLRRYSGIEAQLQALDIGYVRENLREYGAWSEEELADVSACLDRTLWTACGDCFDNPEAYLQPMSLEEIKAAVEAGKTVCWSNEGYEVVKDKLGQWLVVFRSNGFCSGLEHPKGELQGKPEEFFIKEKA